MRIFGGVGVGVQPLGAREPQSETALKYLSRGANILDKEMNGNDSIQ